MKHLLCIVCLLSMLIHIQLATAKTCPPKPVTPDQKLAKLGMQNAKDHGFLWRISKGGHESFLYGTIHAARFKDMFLGPTVMKAVQQSDIVALEIDMQNRNTAAQLVAEIKQLTSHAIPDDLTNKINKAADSVCIPPQQIADLTPEFQVITISIAQAAYDGIYSVFGIDGFLSGISHQMQKQVVSLESPKTQANVLSTDTPQETIDYVTKTLKQINNGSSQKIMQRMYQAWLDSNHDVFNHYQDWCECMDTDIDQKYMKRLLDERNVKLAQNIDKLHSTKQTVFAAVGTLHLFGNAGVTKLMEEKGYNVEKVVF